MNTIRILLLTFVLLLAITLGTKTVLAVGGVVNSYHQAINSALNVALEDRAGRPMQQR